jgi:predicted GNAT superfamily acetyltransferase
MLSGAGTLARVRGRGVFRTLIAHRLASARAAGMGAATIQAFADTSAPICTRLGFESLGELRLYVRDA